MNENTNDIQKEIESVLENDEAYGSNVTILNWSSTPTKITGKFKDAWNNRVFDFTIDEDGVGYKPSVNLDAVPVESQEGRFDSFSDGYLSNIRADGKLTGKRTKKPKCGGTSFGCGYSCVGLTKVCRITVGRKKLTANQGSNISKERISKLLAMASKPGVDPKFQAHYARASTERTIVQQSGKRRSMMHGKPAEAAEITKPKEATTTQKKAPAEVSTKPIIDPEVFETKFPSKEVQREYGIGGAVDRAKEVISFVKNPKEFSQLTPRDQAGFLDNIATIHGVSDKDHEESLKSPAVQNDEGRKIGTEALNVRAQGSKQMWDNLTLGEKGKLAQALKDVDSSLINPDDQYKNKYVKQLADEIRQLLK